MMRMFSVGVFALLLAACAVPPPERAVQGAPAHDVIGVTEVHLDPQFWLKRTRDGDRIVLDAAEIAAQNDKLARLDESVHDIEQLPAVLSGDEVRALVTSLSTPPRGPLYDANGQAVPEAALTELVRSVHLDAIPAQQAARFGRYGQNYQALGCVRDGSGYLQRA